MGTCVSVFIYLVNKPCFRRMVHGIIFTWLNYIYTEFTDRIGVWHFSYFPCWWLVRVHLAGVLFLFVRLSEEPKHKLKNKISKNFRKTKTYFWKFPEMSTSKCCREVSFGHFWVRFLGIGKETCQEAHCAIKWKILKTKFQKNWGKNLFLKISRNVNFKML